MGRIRILPETVANKIAAGEVVERPASVVKELLENALDAGATRIRVEVEAGGKKRVQVVDDGCGMVRDDAMLAFERHATSKLRSADDLLSITTMGFRGEALPSIAAVSRLVLETRSPEETAGTRVEIAGGRLLNIQEAGLPPGTSVTVRDLFYNTPARRKFLRAEATELSHISTFVTHAALAFPEKLFLLSTPSGDLVNVSPVGSLRDRVFQLFGDELLENLVEFGPATKEILVAPAAEEATPDTEVSELSRVMVSGFLSRPQVQKPNRNGIYIFVNRRQVRDRVLLHAIQESYRNLIPSGSFPVALLFLELPYTEVDVNVHPSKIEVRFRHQTFIHDLVRDALRECLTKTRPISTFPAEATCAPAEGIQVSHPAQTSPTTGQENFRLREPSATAQEPLLRLGGMGKELSDLLYSPRATGSVSQGKLSEQAPPSASELSELQPLGQIRDSFIVAASPSGLWLIDQHVAHERVLFEKFLADRARGTIERQQLLMPYILRLTPPQQALWQQIESELAAAGFETELFGHNTVAVKAAPAGVKTEALEKLLTELIETLEKESRALTPEAVREKIAASVACHAAIKVNTPLEPRKMEWLLAELAATRFPMSCPHGRPVVLKYGMREILKAFHRI
ncbi:MAG: DNA mismatch repair endonuclease MutL [Acidobacteria bacterium]|nr:DNA mismatch repair endonuclease MutL [Acidobacteriota bacterium]